MYEVLFTCCDSCLLFWELVVVFFGYWAILGILCWHCRLCLELFVVMCLVFCSFRYVGYGVYKVLFTCCDSCLLFLELMVVFFEYLALVLIVSCVLLALPAMLGIVGCVVLSVLFNGKCWLWCG